MIVRGLRDVILNVSGKSIKVKKGQEIDINDIDAQMHIKAGYIEHIISEFTTKKRGKSNGNH
jgi:hypothetical protein